MFVCGGGGGCGGVGVWRRTDDVVLASRHHQTVAKSRYPIPSPPLTHMLVILTRATCSCFFENVPGILYCELDYVVQMVMILALYAAIP